MKNLITAANALIAISAAPTSFDKLLHDWHYGGADDALGAKIEEAAKEAGLKQAKSANLVRALGLSVAEFKAVLKTGKTLPYNGAKYTSWTSVDNMETVDMYLRKDFGIVTTAKIPSSNIVLDFMAYAKYVRANKLPTEFNLNDLAVEKEYVVKNAPKDVEIEGYLIPTEYASRMDKAGIDYDYWEICCYVDAAEAASLMALFIK